MERSDQSFEPLTPASVHSRMTALCSEQKFCSPGRAKAMLIVIVLVLRRMRAIAAA